ncbi:hypothetical protein ACFYZ9_31005 [Streptomyces sp. NPDC001691]|uniref:hypothetical protein n=1 Tax=Streptomyces sp. NPDC001691 TaxID=3364600 RepID=UPI0036CDF2F4
MPVTEGSEGMPQSLSCSKALHTARGVLGSALKSVQPWITEAVAVARQGTMNQV